MLCYPSLTIYFSLQLQHKIYMKYRDVLHFSHSSALCQLADLLHHSLYTHLYSLNSAISFGPFSSIPPSVHSVTVLLMLERMQAKS